MRSFLSWTTLPFLLAISGAACSSGNTSTAGGSGDGGNGDDGGDGSSTSDSASTGDSAGTGDSGVANDGAGGSDSAMDADSQTPLDSGMWGDPLGVNLGSSGDYVILAMSGISNVPISAITGNLGISPATATSITGFPLTLDSTNVFSTTPQVTGKIYASTYAVPTPANLTTAIGDMMTAYTDAAGRAPNVTELGAGNIGGATITRGVYKWGTGLLIPTDITLSGSATDVWIFQIAQNLTVSNTARVTLSGGAVPANIFWEVAGAVSVGTTAHMEGTILSKTMVAMKTGSSINGRLMAQTAVTLQSATVVHP